MVNRKKNGGKNIHQFRSFSGIEAKLANPFPGDSVFLIYSDVQHREKWVLWCMVNERIATNTWFQEHPKHTWTYRSRGGVK